MDWMDLAQDRNRWRALVDVVMNLRIPLKCGVFIDRTILAAEGD
jgi:hypothetical protein